MVVETVEALVLLLEREKVILLIVRVVTVGDGVKTDSMIHGNEPVHS